MVVVKTKSYELAVSVAGNENADNLALVLPGRLDTKDYENMKGHVAYLASKGYFAVSFDPPGSWESAGSIEMYTMTNYLKAINELIEYYGNKPTLLLGHSRGGSMAVLAGLRNPLVTKFVAIFSACSYAPGKYSGNPDQEWEKRGYKINKRDVPGSSDKFVEYKLPYSFVEDSGQYDMYEELSKSKKPKLFVYGERDELVPPKLAKEVFGIASEPKELASINSDHDYRKHPELIDEVNVIVGRFLDKYEI